MNEYTPFFSEFAAFFYYFILLLVIFCSLLAWITDKNQYADIFKYGSIVSAILACLTVWGKLLFNKVGNKKY